MILIYELARNPNLIFHEHMKFYLLCTTIILLFLFSSCKSSKKVTTIDFHDGSYVGEVDDKGLKHGKGSYKWLDGSFYEGDFENDLRHGTGHFRWANGESYKGDYLQDQRTGQGLYSWPDGSFYEGSFLNGKRHGTGLFTASNGAKYEGEWFDDQRHGQGTLTDQDNHLVRGIWQNGKLLTKPMDLPKTTTKPDISLDTAVIDSENSGNQDTSQGKIEPHPFQVDSSQTTSDANGILVTGSPLPENFESNNNPSENDENVETGNFPDIKNQNSNQDSEILPENRKEKSTLDPNSLQEEENIWAGTVDEVEIKFITKLMDGVDTIFDRNTNRAYTGRMRILDNSGKINGELELLNGRMHGEELYFEDGKVIEKNLWGDGKFIKNLPIN